MSEKNFQSAAQGNSSAEHSSGQAEALPDRVEFQDGSQPDSALEHINRDHSASEQRTEKSVLPKRFFPLDPRSVRVDQLTGLFIFFALMIGALVGLAVSFFSVGRPTWIWWSVAGGSAAAACILFFLTLYWPKLEFRYSRWAWDADGLEIHRGVFWQHRITVPISRIQHVDVSQGPLQRQFGLGKVTVHTAGTQHAAVELSGIAYEAAVWLREQIIAGQGGEDAV